jgi:UDP-N-acetyl-2-amino-2-deoxyglucuronate dehydrogenase
MRSEADAICERPLVLNPWNMDELAGIQKDTGRQLGGERECRCPATGERYRLAPNGLELAAE